MLEGRPECCMHMRPLALEKITPLTEKKDQEWELPAIGEGTDSWEAQSNQVRLTQEHLAPQLTPLFKERWDGGEGDYVLQAALCGFQGTTVRDRFPEDHHPLRSQREITGQPCHLVTKLRIVVSQGLHWDITHPHTCSLILYITS